jgi:hypothetical protein
MIWTYFEISQIWSYLERYKVPFITLQSNTSYFYHKTEFGFVINTNTTADEEFKVARNVTGAV